MSQSKTLTLIVPIYRPSITLDEIFRNLKKQTEKNFNVILIVDQPKDEDFKAIAKLKSEFQDNLKVIINSAHQLIDIVIKQAMSFVETEYVYILYSYTVLKKEFTKRINSYLEKSAVKPDFIEILGSVKGLVNLDFNGENFDENLVINLKNSDEPILFTAPVAFNIVIKSEIFKDILNAQKFKNINLQYTPASTYKGLLNSQTFAFIKNTWVEDWNYDPILLNPKSLAKTWTTIINLAQEKCPDKINALRFAEFINICYYGAGYIGMCKIKRNTQEWRSLKNIKLAFESEIKKHLPVWEQELEKNPYFEKYNAKELLKLVLDSSNWESIYKKFKW
ncbi:glycosyltransferase family A protein [Metamycoplasma spumans]|uniref:glycosyltransferase family A protein n=1 Tax=Metamycoplasma spumans TaxID=92406 RepID=UPI0034DD9FB7